MKKSYESGVATHIGPESWGAARKSSDEALTGERAGRVSRARTFLRDADAVRRCGRPHSVHRAQRARAGGWETDTGGGRDAPGRQCHAPYTKGNVGRRVLSIWHIFME